MTRTAKGLLFLAALALAGLGWLWLQPRSATDCAARDSGCLRQVAEHLIAESFEQNRLSTISDQLQAAGRLLATEGAIDLAAQADRLTRMGFAPHSIPAVRDRYFDALTDPTYPFDIPAAIAAETGPEGTDLEDYLTSAFRLAFADPLRRTEALALWDRHFDRLAKLGNRAEAVVWFGLSWLARNDPARAGTYFKRAADTRTFLSGQGGWLSFFRTAALHCQDGRKDQGRALLDGLRTYFLPQHHVELYLPALLDCEGKDAALVAVDLALSQWADWAERVWTDDPTSAEYIANALDQLSGDLRRELANWLHQQNRSAEVADLWSRYGAAEIAHRHVPRLDWLPARLADSQALPVPNAPRVDADGEPAEGRLKKLAEEGTRDFSLAYEERSAERIIELNWPAPMAIAAAQGLVRYSEGDPLVTAFVVGLERQLGCTPSEARMQTLLNDISAFKAPLDEARAIIELLRFTPPLVTGTAFAGHDCIVD